MNGATKKRRVGAIPEAFAAITFSQNGHSVDFEVLNSASYYQKPESNATHLYIYHLVPINVESSPSI